MQHLAPLIVDLAIILAIAGFVTILFHRLKQPIVLGYLIAGVLVGPYTTPIIHVTDVDHIFTLAELGVIFLMFSLGLEFSFRKLTNVGFSATITGFVEVIVMGAVGFLLAELLHWKFYDALFLGAAIAISSTTIIIKAFEDLHLKHKRFVELVFGVLIIEDLLAILILVLLSTIVAGQTLFSTHMLWAVLRLIVVVGGWFIVGYFIVPYWINRISRMISAETLTVISVALCLGLSVLAAKMNYSVALGAFIMGSILAETPQIQLIEKLITPLRNIFGTVFFVSVGMLINPIAIFQDWKTILLISAVVIVTKILSSALGAMLTGQRVGTSVRVGFSMAQIGEFSFIIASLGLSLGVTSKTFYPIIVAVSAITTFTTPYFIKYSANVNAWLGKHLPKNIFYLFDSYAAWIYRISGRGREKKQYQAAIVRLLINAIVVAIIFVLTARYLFPLGQQMFSRALWANIIIWALSIIFSLPFLWGMVFAFKTRVSKSYQRLPAIIISFCFAVTEVFLLSIYFFESWAVAILLLVIIGAVFAILYRRVEKYYSWFERGLLNNISQNNEKAEQLFDRLAPWEHFLVQLQVAHHSWLAFKKLSETHLREKYHINVVAIQRGPQLILAPRGEQLLYPLDQLLVLGNENQVETVRELFESQVSVLDESNQLQHFSLGILALHVGSPFVGKNIRQSSIREVSAGTVVGLERKGKKILNPDPSTILEAGDALLIVGDTTRIKKFIQVHQEGLWK